MDAYWKFLETHSDREEIQEEIRREIRKGTIRLIPSPRGIRIVPQAWASAPNNEAIPKPNKPRGRSSRRAEG